MLESFQSAFICDISVVDDDGGDDKFFYLDRFQLLFYSSFSPFRSIMFTILHMTKQSPRACKESGHNHIGGK